MTVILGYCWGKGAFLAADSRRWDLVQNRVLPPVVKLHSIGNLLFAQGGLGTYGDRLRACIVEQRSAIRQSWERMIGTAIPHGRQLHAEALEHASREGVTSVPDMRIIGAGFDPMKGHGFVNMLTLPDGITTSYRPGGVPFLMGPDTPRLARVAQGVAVDQHRFGDRQFQLDLWAARTVALMEQEFPQNVGYPIDMAVVRRVGSKTHSVARRFDTAPGEHDPVFAAPWSKWP